MALAVRGAIIRYVRVPVAQTLLTSFRSMSSHADGHLTKDDVTRRVLDVIKSFPKIDDPSKNFHAPTTTSSETRDHDLTRNLIWISISNHDFGLIFDLDSLKFSILVTPKVHFQKDLGLDSLDNVEIIMAVEEEFKLEIPDLEAIKIDSCNLAIEYVYNHPMSS